ncbi:MAG TPA: hypothetical protein VNL14_13960 [Candidatus Acidoferrales bacterium]|nr:hypothetical protein [Candidatus Acidoferrales bacterium]
MKQCQRCLREAPATHRVESEVIKLDVCNLCAAEAYALMAERHSPGAFERDGRLFLSSLPTQAA